MDPLDLLDAAVLESMEDGRRSRVLHTSFTRQALAHDVDSLNATLFTTRVPAAHPRSDQGCILVF